MFIGTEKISTGSGFQPVWRASDRAHTKGMPDLLHGYLADGHWDGRALELNWSGYRLSSVFQPIVSFSHARVVAHEALLRAHDEVGRCVGPSTLFSPLFEREDLLHLDRASRLMHIVNSRQAPGCFFLNLHPRLFESLRDGDSMMAAKAIGEFIGATESRYIIEILEEEIADHVHFEEGVAALRSVGLGVALDDFGAGHSNFDRVWKIRPDVVKLDRTFAARASEDRSVRRLLPQIVSVLHEAGTLVLLEGVETLDQAKIAMDSNVDFGQGWFFALPASAPGADIDEIRARMESVSGASVGGVAPVADLAHRLLLPYQSGIREASLRLAMGGALADVALRWLELPHAAAIYLLDAEGRQSGAALENPQGVARSSGFCLGHIEGARWSQREHFIKAIHSPGEAQVTRPYLSVATGRVCVTVSICVMLGGSHVVLCGDIDWSPLEAAAIEPHALDYRI